MKAPTRDELFQQMARSLPATPESDATDAPAAAAAPELSHTLQTTGAGSNESTVPAGAQTPATGRTYRLGDRLPEEGFPHRPHSRQGMRPLTLENLQYLLWCYEILVKYDVIKKRVRVPAPTASVVPLPETVMARQFGSAAGMVSSVKLAPALVDSSTRELLDGVVDIVAPMIWREPIRAAAAGETKS